MKRLLILATFAVLSALGPAARAQTYTMTDLGTPLENPGEFSSVFGINDSGVVIGYSTTSGAFDDAFYWKDGVATALPASAGYDTPITVITQVGINSTGQIVGVESEQEYDSNSFQYQNGVTTALNVSDGNIAQGPTAAAINNAGQIVGGAGASGFAFLYYNGITTNLGFLPGGTISTATCINNAASTEIAGSSTLTSGATHATLWKNNAAYDLGTLGGPNSVAYGINDSGQVVGQSDINIKDTDGNYEYRAFLWTPTTPNATTGTMQNLGVLTGQSDSVALALNNSGTIVGDSNASSPTGGMPAFVWDSVHGMRNLQSLLAPSTVPPSAILQSAVSINAQGQIVGDFSQLSSSYGYVLTPTTTTDVTVASFSVNPTTVVSGSATIGTITLSGAAPTGGTATTLSENGAPRYTVTVPAGMTSSTFSLPFTGYAAGTYTEVDSYNGSKATVVVTVTVPAAATLTGISLNPSAVTGGQTSTGTVTLSAAAPTGGTTVTLTSDLAAAIAPASVTVAAGATSATFTVNTTAVTTLQTADITASYGGQNQTASVDISPPAVAPTALSSLTASPATLSGGAIIVTGTVTLSAAATAATTVTLASSSTAALTVPASVTVAAGATSATFTATSYSVTTATAVTVTGMYGTVSKTATVTVNPPAVVPTALSSLTASPTTLSGGAIIVTGTVTLSAAATAATTVTLASSSTAALTVPASVTVAAGATSATFTATSHGVSTQTTVVITATWAGVAKTATVTVNPAALSSLTFSPATLTGGVTTTGTITLSGSVSSATTITLVSSNPAALSVPASVTVVVYGKSATFTATSSSVAASTPVTVTATLGGSTQTATVTVNPPAVVVPVSITSSPNPVYSSGDSIITVTLSGGAPTGGTSISISDDGAVVYTGTVAAGQSTLALPANWQTVTTATMSTLTATCNGTKVTGTVTIQPTTVTITSLVYSPGTVKGGGSATGTITLSAPAPAGGAHVVLSGAVSYAVDIPAGQTAASYPQPTSAVTASTIYTFNAAYNGKTVSSTLTATP